ncbi:LysR substrate-binding domain-containing protein [Pseudochelatococcus sp. B33]
MRFTLSGHADHWEFRKGGEIERIRPNGCYKVTSSLAMRGALLAGFGLSLIPLPYVAEDLKAQRLRAVLKDWSSVETTLYAVYLSRHHVAPKLRAFLDFLFEEFARPAA